MNLEKLNLVELNAQEVRLIDGGIPPVSPWWGWAAITVAAYDLVVGIHEGIQEGTKKRCGC
ncbi:bacteriocin [Flavobacterium sp.]|uniref:bacteriocin n=1 Tax=Flavobacterium sp. TaxID=239 RepID=UPI004048A658